MKKLMKILLSMFLGLIAIFLAGCGYYLFYNLEFYFELHEIIKGGLKLVIAAFSFILCWLGCYLIIMPIIRKVFE